MNTRRIILLGILLVSGFTRTFRIEEYTGFDFDQELVVTSAQKILEGKPTLIGQETSIPGIFVGPWYTSVVAAILLISKGNPVALPLSQAVLGVLSTWLLYLVGRRFSESAGFVSAFTYVVSDRMIRIDQSSTPTNGIVFLSLFALWLAEQNRLSRASRLLATSAVAGFASQMHPSGFALIVLPIFLLIGTGRRLFLAILSAGVFSFWFAPLLAFDLRHGFLILKSLLSHVADPSYPLVFRSLIVTRIALTSWFRILVPFTPTPILVALSLIVLFFLRDAFRVHRLAGLLLISSPLVFSFYRGPVPEYYLFPSFVGFLLLTSQSVASWSAGLLLRILVIIPILALFAVVNIRSHVQAINPFSLHEKRNVVQFIKSNREGDPVRIRMDIDYGQASGFAYLFRWEGVDAVFADDDPDFIVSVPETRSLGGTTFGGIRVRKTKAI